MWRLPMAADQLDASLFVRRRSLSVFSVPVDVLLLEARVAAQQRRTMRHVFFVFDLTDSCAGGEEYLRSLQAFVDSVARRCRGEDIYSTWCFGVNGVIKHSQPMTTASEVRETLRPLLPIAHKGGTRLVPLWKEMYQQLNASIERGESVVLLFLTDGEIWDLPDFTPPGDLPRVGIGWVGAVRADRESFWPGAVTWPVGDPATESECLRQLFHTDEAQDVQIDSVAIEFSPASNPDFVVDATDLSRPHMHDGCVSGRLALAPLSGTVLARAALAWVDHPAPSVSGSVALRARDSGDGRNVPMPVQSATKLEWEEAILDWMVRECDLTWDWDENLIRWLDDRRCGAAKSPPYVTCPSCCFEQEFTLIRSRCENCGKQILLHRTRRLREGFLQSILAMLIPLHPSGCAEGVPGTPVFIKRTHSLPEGASISLSGDGWHLKVPQRDGVVAGGGDMETTRVKGYDFIEFPRGSRYLFLDLRK
jgi:hypothetical protein